MGEEVSCQPYYHHSIHAPNVIFFMFFSIVAGGVTRRILKSFPRVPYTVVMFLLGILMGFIHIWMNSKYFENSAQVVHCTASYYTQFFGTTIANMEPEYLLHIFLPILIFESAFSMDDYVFRKVLVQAIILAGPGLMLASALTAILPVIFHGWKFLEALLFGAILSATDPVAVVALLKDLGAPPEISTVIEGESLLNDGVAIVMYNILKTAVEEGALPPAWLIIVKFLQFTAGGPLVGWVLGRVAVFCLKHSFNDPLIEVSITVSGAYLCFYLSEGGVHSAAHVSGVLALVTFGQILARRRHAISPEVHHFLHEFWEIAVFWANTLIFVLVGVQSIFNLVGGAISWTDVVWLFVLYVGVNVIRFFVVALLYPILSSKFFAWRLDWKNALLLGWGGLRGGVGLALALALKNATKKDGGFTIDDNTLREEITFFISGIVLLTLLVNGVSTTNLVQGLQLSKVPDDRKQQMRRLVTEIVNAEEKVLRVLQTDNLIADSHWQKVQEVTTDIVRDPYSKPGEKLRVDALEKARGALLRAFKIQVDHHYEQRLAGGLAVRRLLEIADMMLEVPGYFFEIGSKDTFHWMAPFEEESMPGTSGIFVRCLRSVGFIDREVVTQFVTHAYDIGTCFVNAMENIIAKIDSFVQNRHLAAKFREKAAEATQTVLKKLQTLASHYPDIAMALKTKFASRLVLNAGRDAVHHLQHEGIVNPADATALTTQIETAMVAVNRMSRRLELPDPATVLKNISWFSELEREEQVKVKELQQMREAPQDGILVETGSNNQPLGIIMSGIVQIRDATGNVNYLGPGRVINEFSVLTNQPAPYEIMAFTPCKYSTFERNEVMRILGPTQAIDYIWREYGVQVAFNMLSKKLPYILWDHGKVKVHVEGGTLVKCADDESVTMWPKYDYVLLRGEGHTSDGRLYTAPAILPTQEDVDVHSTQYKQRVTEAKAAFTKYCPSDADGAIEEEQLAQLLSYLGWNFSMGEVHRLMDDADADGSGRIEFDEFVQLLHKTTMNFQNKALVYKIARHKIEKDEEEEHEDNVVEINDIVKRQHQRRSTAFGNRPYIKEDSEDGNDLARPLMEEP